MSSSLQNTSDGESQVLSNTKFACNIPEYIEIAAQSIYEALHAFLRYDTIPNPAGGQPIPWVSEIRIPTAKETNTKTGKVYTNVEAAWSVVSQGYCSPTKLSVI
jgi:hypothetical protein